MAYTLDYAISLGSNQTGLTLAARLVDTDGANTGSEITTGFTEIGDGNYHWHYASFPDDHRGGVKFYEDEVPGVILAFASINPEEAEHTAAILADTNELQSDLTDGGRLDLILDGILEDTGTTLDTLLDTLVARLTAARAAKLDNAAQAGTDGDTLETLSDQMDGITGGAGGEGAYTGTLTVNDGSTGLEGVTVHATRGGVLIASGTTDSNGQITDWVFGAYTYTLAARIAGYQPDTDTLTVSADGWTKTISLTALTITPPSSVSLCTVQFRVKLSDTAVSGAVCKAQLLGINQAADGTVLSNAISSDTTDSEGVAELQLVREDSIVKGNGVYKIWVEIASAPVASVETTIPNQNTVLFEDLLGA